MPSALLASAFQQDVCTSNDLKLPSLQAHDEADTCKVGDVVRIHMCRSAVRTCFSVVASQAGQAHETSGAELSVSDLQSASAGLSVDTNPSL